jgi:hypothetical protein
MAELGEGLSGYLDVQDATLRAPRLEAVSNIGIANTAPQHAFSVGSNLYVDTESSNVLTVDGNVVCEGVKVGLIEIIPSYDLAAVSNVGNVTQSTIQFSNATTGFVTTANIEVGTANLFVDTVSGRVGIGKTDPGATLDVTGNAYVSSNLEVGTANLFVDTVSGRVGIGTNSPVSGLTVSKDIESSNSFITERVLFRETWPNGLNSLVGDLGTWVVTNLNQQTNPSATTTPDGYGIVAFNGVPADNGEFVSPAFDLSDYALSDGVLPATNKRKTTTRVFLKCYFGTRNLSASGEVAHVQFSPDNGSTWYTVATSQDEKNTDRFTMVSADLSPYILETSTNAKIRFYMPWSVAGGDYMRIGRIWIHESDVPTNLGGMWLGAGGNIGIGKMNPSTLLDLKRDSTNGASIQFESSGGYKTSIGQKSSGVGDRALQFTSYGSAATSNPVYNFLALNDAANAYNKILTMLGNGNVGIGDESPSYKLDIPTGNQCFINGVRFFTFGSNTANAVVDSGIPMKGYAGGGSVLLFFSFHNSGGDYTRTDAYILRKSYDATWVSDSTSVHTICSLRGTNSQTGTLTFGFNGNHLTCSYSQGGAQNYYALSFDNF